MPKKAAAKKPASAAKPAKKAKKHTRTTYRVKNRFVFKHHTNERYFIMVKGQRVYMSWKAVRHGMKVMRNAAKREENRLKDIAYDKAYRAKKKKEKKEKKEKRERKEKERRKANRRMGYK